VERLDLEPSWQSHLPEDQLLQFSVKPALLGHSLKDAANVKIPAGKSCFVLEMSGTRSSAEPSAFAETEAPRGCELPMLSTGWEWPLGCLY
jgi:hypothetical protein